jgi:hypothetical protein
VISFLAFLIEKRNFYFFLRDSNCRKKGEISFCGIFPFVD